MTSEKHRKRITPDIEPVVLRNPISPDMAQMRTTLLGSLLDVLGYNINRKNTNNQLFEIAKTFAATEADTLPDERDVVAVLIEGDYEPASWQQNARPANFYLLKSAIDNLARHCHADKIDYQALDGNHAYLSSESASVEWNNGVKGVCGKIREDICKAFEINSAVYYAELDITEFISANPSTQSYHPLPRYPAAERDFCFVMPESLHSSVISKEMMTVSPLVESAEPFDVYRGEKLGKGLKSIAYAVRLRKPDKTLTDAEAEEVCTTIIKTMKEKHGAVLRT